MSQICDLKLKTAGNFFVITMQNSKTETEFQSKLEVLLETILKKSD